MLQPPDTSLSTSAPGLRLLEARCTIIPDEDPQRDVETPDHDGEDSDGLEEELGAEDDPQDDDDEADEDLDEPETPPPSSRQRRPFPVWLMDRFNARREELKSRDANGLPPLYSHDETFWFPQKSTFFFLQQQSCSPPQLYNPRFFLWDPECLCDRIPCPNCKQPLQRHGEILHPRRCVSLDSTFWIIGYRYRCGNCFHPRTNKRTVTFRSWDPRILAVLPPALAAEFPAHLTHRSGISNVLFSWMRSCFQCGMGSKQISDAVRTQHLLNHDLLHLQYLQHLALRKSSLDSWTGRKYEAFLSFDDAGPRG